MKLGPMNQAGSVWTADFCGASFYIDDRRFVLTEAGEVYQESNHTFTPASEEDALAVRALSEEDAAITRARSDLAHQRAGGNDALRFVLLSSMRYENGAPELFTLDAFPGIQFGRVGRNSTHAFYAGVSKNGGKFYLAEDSDAEQYGGERYSFKELQTWSEVGYWGHL